MGTPGRLLLLVALACASSSGLGRAETPAGERGFRSGRLAPSRTRQVKLARLRSVDRLLRKEAGHTFESGVLLVARNNRPVLHRAYGNATRDSVFDLASLTKPLATTATLMRVLGEKRLPLTTRLDRLLPSLRGQATGAVTLEQLLSHSSGLPARNTIGDQTRGQPPAAARRIARRSAAQARPQFRPGTQSLYSDLNYILLDWALEAITGKPLQQLSHELVYRPLGLHRTGFMSRLDPALNLRQQKFVSTEEVAGRGRLTGVVHDEKAYAMGGVSGHAGLFASAGDVQRIAQSMMDAYNGRPSIFSREIVRQFFDARPVAEGSWALGFDRAAGNSTTGRRMAGSAIGHLGFTGTSLWMDPRTDQVTVFLTNRVYYGRDPERIRQLRPRLHDYVNRVLAPAPGSTGGEARP